jgi:hypothetical protein
VNKTSIFVIDYLNYEYDSPELDEPEWTINDINNGSWKIDLNGVKRNIKGERLVV